MASRTPYPEAARELLRQTLFDAARDHLERRPWAEVTMSDIAAAAGVSRQTLYKEFGNRSDFAVALTIHEGERFLGSVEDAIRANTDDPRAAVLAALELFLRTAGDDQLIRMLLSDDGSGGMLPFVTTQGLPVVAWATGRLSTVIEEGWPQAPKDDVALLSEALVRLAISYITNPSEAPDSTAVSVADLLGPFIDRALGTG
ncbi:MAG TPA: TetR family transcriptional regulator [Solirubrobacterales bacterium]|nr:TetR family transcriptional regulator [Solirubrobacterales bacterium]